MKLSGYHCMCGPVHHGYNFVEGRHAVKVFKDDDGFPWDSNHINLNCDEHGIFVQDFEDSSWLKCEDIGSETSFIIDYSEYNGTLPDTLYIGILQSFWNNGCPDKPDMVDLLEIHLSLRNPPPE